MKAFIIKTCDVVAYISGVLITLIGLIVIANMETYQVPAFMGLVICLIIWCLCSGFWFVLSGMYDELRKLNGTPVDTGSLHDGPNCHAEPESDYWKKRVDAAEQWKPKMT